MSDFIHAAHDPYEKTCRQLNQYALLILIPDESGAVGLY
jgi:hypothetical protein